MAGSAITITSNAVDVSREMKVIAARFGNALPAMQIIGQRVVKSVVENFMVGGRPQGWQPLAPATLAAKKGGSILVGKGFGGGLLGSIHAEPENDAVVVGTDKVYGAVHQFGGKAGRGLKTTIPQREFLLIQDGDYQEIKEDLGHFILRGF
jgi:phage virion morphogenesis protein